uniref:Uncharacterized protein n=1 Tax=Panagrolaimus superbus TaxID=310955 RepID=A0A914ZH64_9BILA
MKTQKKNYENIIHQMTEDHDKFVQRSEASRQKMEVEIAKLAKENSKLIDPDRMCLIKHVAPHGKVDYYHLNGKILLVKKLVLDGQKFIADGIEVTFDDSEFQIHVNHELAVKHTFFLTIPKRIKYCNIVKLSLEDLTLTFNEYKDIIESCNIECLSLQRLTVEQYSNVIDVADLLKEVPNIEYFEYTFNKRESIPCHKLAELHPFPRLQRLHVNEIHENFDIKTFAEFIKKNPTVSYELSLRCCPKFFGKVKSVEKDAVPASYKVKIVKLK